MYVFITFFFIIYYNINLFLVQYILNCKGRIERLRESIFIIFNQKMVNKYTILMNIN